VEAWRAAHPAMPLECRSIGISGVAVVADLALRQAVWNLLENAAEVSPRLLHLSATLQDGMLVLAVRDHGPGIPAAVLAHFGQPTESMKGEGHGLGLFLVATVMRRLGGRVEPVNLALGGAEVRLFVPISRKLTPDV
jgi:two-component system sensor histidine kinase RegB